MRAGSTRSDGDFPKGLTLLSLLIVGVMIPGVGCRESSSPSAPQVQSESPALQMQDRRQPRVVAFRQADLSGTYLLTRTTSCPGVASATTTESVDFVQSGDFIQVFIPVAHSQISGTLRGTTIDFVWIDSILICNTALLGTATIGEKSISGSVSGIETDGRCECHDTTTTIAFTLVKE